MGEQAASGAVEAVGLLVGMFGQDAVESEVQEAFGGWPARRAPALRAL
ncbi:hypothetical protein SAZ_42525 [Streptomyces noursei ZPM]|nr:hypothetical protein [Streptomyces noursei]AKA08285.1 hypothetical protein SAZ_00280 [Streptomyces noursei ZPM]AKA09311.1 hypothetical protein SAZ_42525 [Streptomyces noursei ZPM]EPY92328.1 hypothetical protein K530_53840 [Streptomyces noursei CCRC 11814]